MHATNCYIFVTFYWWGERSGPNLFEVIEWGHVCDSAVGITWVHISRLPVLHPDNDRWKFTFVILKLMWAPCAGFMWTARSYHSWCHFLFQTICSFYYHLECTIKVASELHVKITWVHVSRLPMPHLDRDWWKCTMFTNKFYILACHFKKTLQGSIFYSLNNTMK